MGKKLYKKKIKKKNKKEIKNGNTNTSNTSDSSDLNKESNNDEKGIEKKENNEDNLCIICLAEYDNKFHIMKKLKCRHTLCEYCFNKWYKIKEFCPICRKKLFTNPSDRPDFLSIVKDLYLHHDNHFSRDY